MKLQRDGSFDPARHTQELGEGAVCYNCGRSAPVGFYNRRSGRVLCPDCVMYTVKRQAGKANGEPLVNPADTVAATSVAEQPPAPPQKTK